MYTAFMASTLHIGRLVGGGIVLGWGCSSSCRHCLYNSTPRRKDGKPGPKALEKLLDALVERGPHARYHIGGGEPFLDIPLLRQAIIGMEERGLGLDYVETNSSWATSRERTEQVLSDLASVGLSCVLVSVSPFHAEFIPPKKTLTVIEVAQQVVPGGAFVWLPNFLNLLTRSHQDQTLDLDALLDANGDQFALGLASEYGLIPGGRAGQYLARHGIAVPWEEAAYEAPCITRFKDTSHFHVDGNGLYVPGFCAGLAIPLDSLPGSVSLDGFPVLQTLTEPDGLRQLVESAVQKGFSPKETYSAPCHLCAHVRSFLFQTNPTPDLAPAGFYESMI